MDAAAPFRLLVVCTANVCRSPFAEAVLVRRLAGRGAAGAVEVTSAGTRALVGSPVDPTMAGHLDDDEAAVLRGRTARPLDEALVRRADLVVAMSREHRRAVVALVPARQRRVFTLLELARTARVAAADAAPADDLPGALRSLTAAAAPLRGPTAPTDPADDDVADPHRRSAADYAAAAGLVRRAVDEVVRAVPVR